MILVDTNIPLRIAQAGQIQSLNPFDVLAIPRT